MCSPDQEEEISYDSDSSGVSMSDDYTDDANDEGPILSMQDSPDSPDPEPTEPDPDEDPVIKAIRDESEKRRDHPPQIICEEFITTLCFHPTRDLIALASILGDVYLYEYSNDKNTLVNTLEVHTNACRDVEFSGDGKIMFSCGKDKTIMLSDMESDGKLVRYYERAHEEAINCIKPVNENLFATGDESGEIRLWDLRQRTDKSVYNLRKNEDFISDLVVDEAEKYLLCSSGDGSLTTVDLRGRKLFMQSEEYEEELTCLGLFRSETKLVAGSSKGKLLLFNWNEFGLHSDEFPGPKSVINDLVPITENIVVTACEDGNLRAANLFPHRYLGVVGQHNFSVEGVDICNSGEFIASISHSNDVKFWNIKYFEDYEDLSKKHSKSNKRKEMQNNLPSSKMTNASDFFSGLC